MEAVIGKEVEEWMNMERQQWKRRERYKVKREPEEARV